MRPKLMVIASAEPDVRFTDVPADRRAYPRVPSSRLRIGRIRIPHRPAVSLVDLSSGGALLQLPFQMRPSSRFVVELQTEVEQVHVHFQLLRCYVADLKGGITYRAAGAFDGVLNLQQLAAGAETALQRLINTLERLLRAGRQSAAEPKAAEFNEILAEVLFRLQNGESCDVVAQNVKARLTQAYPSLTVVPPLVPHWDASTSVQCFGLTFTSGKALTATDRRFLKANAQLISMLEECRREMRDYDGDDSSAPVQIFDLASEWQAAAQST